MTDLRSHFTPDPGLRHGWQLFDDGEGNFVQNRQPLCMLEERVAERAEQHEKQDGLIAAAESTAKKPEKVG